MFESRQNGSPTHLRDSYFRQTRRAFTLIELLVVIAIIAILARCFCRRCRRQEKGADHYVSWQYETMGLAFHMYSDENNDFVPEEGYLQSH